MITLTGDTDENIQELAIKTVYEMIYPPVSWDKAATATLLVEVIAEYQGGAVVLEGGISQVRGLQKPCLIANIRSSRSARRADTKTD
mgnify:FL=1|jgi:hypothetical protein